MKKKLKADSVDELFEIVKAVQNGEDPEEYAKRKRQEALEAERQAEEAAKRKREEERERAEAVKRKRQEEREKAELAKRKRQEEREKAELAEQKQQEEYKIAALQDDADSDEEDFERLLEDDSEEEFDGIRSAAQGIQESLGAVGGFLGEKGRAAKETLTGWKASVSEKFTSIRKEHEAQKEEHAAQKETPDEEEHAAQQVRPDEKRQAEQRETPEPSERENFGAEPELHTNHDLDTAGEDRTRELGRVHLTDIEKEPVGKTRRRYGAKSISEESETIGKRILHSLHMDSDAENPEKQTAGAEDSHASQESVSERKQKALGESGRDMEEIDADSIDLDTVQILDRLLDTAAAGGGTTPEQPKTQKENEPINKEEAANEDEPVSKEEATGKEEQTDKEEPVSKGEPANEAAAETESAEVNEQIAVETVSEAEEPQKTSESTGEAKTRSSVREILHDAKKRRVLIGSVAAAVVLIVIAAVSVLHHSSQLQEKRKYVTADEGLTITVENQPTEWCSSYELKMKVSVKGAKISSVEIDGASAKPDDEGYVTVSAQSTPLEVTVTTESGTLEASVEIPMLDTEAPSVTADITGGQIVLSASDSRSGVGQIRYAAVRDGDWLQLPQYQDYDEPFTYEEDCMYYFYAVDRAGNCSVPVVSNMVTRSAAVATEAVVTISAIGDCTLGTYKGSVTSTSFDTYYSMYGATWFFQNVKDILSNDDVTFANLEGPLTESTDAADKTYAFKGDPSYTEILQDGSIEVVTLANNHSSDYGTQGLADTRENLTEAEISYCIGDTIAYQDISGVKTAFIGIYELAAGLECETQVRETIAEAQSEGAQLIIIAFHWGTEKENYADETQQSLAHTAIDCGADLVVGHHPHVLQGIEKYNGKYIVYSLGNFCFGGNSNPSDKDTMIFRQTFTVTADGVSLDDEIEIIPCTLSSASGYNDYRPTPATGTAADEIMERINEYSAEFGDITYTASAGV